MHVKNSLHGLCLCIIIIIIIKVSSCYCYNVNQIEEVALLPLHS